MRKRLDDGLIEEHIIAPVAELVDAADSKSVIRKDVGVRVSPGAPMIIVLQCLENSVLFIYPVEYSFQENNVACKPKYILFIERVL